MKGRKGERRKKGGLAWLRDKEVLHDQWKESIIVPVHKKDDKTDCSTYHGISLLANSLKIL
jgi:hypothetical protein